MTAGSAWRRVWGNGAAAVARGAESEAKFLDSVGIGPSYRFQFAELVDADLRRMAELVRRYADQRLGGTDASVIAICERLSITTVATVNRQQIRPVMIEGAEPMDRIFPTLGAGDEDRR